MEFNFICLDNLQLFEFIKLIFKIKMFILLPFDCTTQGGSTNLRPPPQP